MTEPKDDDLDLDLHDLDAELLASFEAQPPAVGFADRVMAAWSAEQAEGDETLPKGAPGAARGGASPQRPTTSLARSILVAAAGAAAAILVMAVVELWPTLPVDGSHEARTRAELSLGGRATAVVEPGADLSWRVTFGGDAFVEQRRGEVFYRVERGGTFLVTTPAGQARVTGTSFSLEVDEMTTEGMTKRGALLTGAAAGAAVTAALLLTVYEGSVVLAGRGGEVAVTAGERARMGPDGVPSKLSAESRHGKAFSDEEREAERQALKLRVRDLEERLKELMVAGSRGEDPLSGEARACEERLLTLERELEVEQQLNREREGEPVPFPEDLPARYREDALKSAFLDILARSGLEGDVVALDCNEFPCVVYGEYEVPWAEASHYDAAFQKVEGLLHEHFPPSENGHHIRSMTNQDKEKGEGKVMFGISVMPKASEPTGEVKKNIQRRLQHRNQQFFEATWGQR